MIRHSVDYQKRVHDGLQPGRWLTVRAAEHFSGLPLNWTDPTPGVVDVQSFREHFPHPQAGGCFVAANEFKVRRIDWQASKTLKCVSLFTGVAGLELGLRQCALRSSFGVSSFPCFVVEFAMSCAVAAIGVLGG